MSNIIQVIEGLEHLRSLTPATKLDVLNAEFDLGLKFADEFKEYVLKYGVISAKRVEITGVCEFPRLSVVNVTVKEREFNNNIPDDMYVIESTGFEGMVILQNSKGEIFSLVPNGMPKKIFETLADYLLDLQNY